MFGLPNTYESASQIAMALIYDMRVERICLQYMLLKPD
jgi:hypothetical protein